LANSKTWSAPRSSATGAGACWNISRQRASSASRSRRANTTSVISWPWLNTPPTAWSASRIGVKL
jgi:hypothetical protein